jgi:hypothetical protein
VSAVTESTSLRWTTSAWRDEAYAWIEQTLRDTGLTRTGEIEQPRVRFWSTQLTVPTDAGRLWFKENCPGQRFEAGLVEVLADVVPDHVVAPIAVERERGWLLSPDAGPTLRAAGDGEDRWERLAANWADLQRRVADHADRLVEAGTPALPPRDIADLVAERVDELAALPPGDPAHLDAGDAARLRSGLPTIARWAEDVAATGLPLSLDHNDLHSGNAFALRPGEEHLRFFDFGDAVVGHPFGSLLVPINVLVHELSTYEDDPRLVRIVDAYLEVWSDLADLDTLRGAVDPARQLGRVNRSESWRRVLRSANAEERAEFGDSQTYWLTTLLEHPAFST